MEALFGHKPNFTPIASYDFQEKDSLNGDDDDNHFLDKENNILESPLNLDAWLHNDDEWVQVETLKYDYVTHETSDNACLEWDRERWNEEKVRNMEKQQFEEVKLQKQMEFDEKKHTQEYEFEKERWNQELELNEKQCHMYLTIVALSSSRAIAELEQILTLINKK
ncbi:hypothetical protein O181_067894 [Austropuccinia psidii MF-1]|uniref:Uncharacterized protein n=1 Tax=Austropuccinia psidii MF-1 TaxID=1389203 RepID=A0A9Q3EVV9_9BASI|nr:hypothetical protein [Austropuccinia psidii MF-1]